MATTDVFVAPGFIDLQVNGFAGVDFNSPAAPHEEIRRRYRRDVLDRRDALLSDRDHGRAGRDARRAAQSGGGARIAGGRTRRSRRFTSKARTFLPKTARAARIPREWVRPPDFDEFHRWQEPRTAMCGWSRSSPEWPGAPRYIEQITRRAWWSAIGHTRATAQQIRDAVAAGATLSTHLGNGAGNATRTEDFIALISLRNASGGNFIVDGHHLPDAFLRRALRAKGVERSILVTDAVVPAMCAPGPYMLGERRGGTAGG